MRPTKHGSDSRKYFDWLEISARDLLAARLLIEQEQCYDIAGFHCQQCIEKALKAYLLFKRKIHIDGHNLTYLCRQAVKLDKRFTDWLDESAVLNRYYIETRYPADFPLELDKTQLKKIYRIATDMYYFIEREIA
jgi:HEPN domain-containing protein